MYIHTYCEVKQTLGSITTNKGNGCDEIRAELFQILNDDSVKVLAFNFPADLENSALATGLEMVSFHPNHKEMQCQIIFKILHNCPHLTCQQGNAENFPSLASAVYESRSSRCSSWIYKRQRNQRSNCQCPLDHRKSKRVPEIHLLY